MSAQRGAVEELAIFLASEPGALAKLLEEHRNDGRGHCRICTVGGQQGYQLWPCNIAAAAERAAHIRAAEAPW
jgi:hypothetical protein